MTARSISLAIQIGASVFTLAGIYLGSTTAAGAAAYLIGCGFWHALTWRERLWGIVPLNCATTALLLLNLWRAAA